jgi:hypothetical protein
MLPIFAIFVLTPGIQANANQTWQQIPNIVIKGATYPEASKNNPKDVVCEFTGTLVKGVFTHSLLLPAQSTDNFPETWFRKTLNSIRVPKQKENLQGHFQLRFTPMELVLAGGEPITLWFKK